MKNKYLNFERLRERSGLDFEHENRPKSFLSLLLVGLVSTGFKLLNLPPKPNFQFLIAYDSNPTDHVIWTCSLGFGLSGSNRFV